MTSIGLYTIAMIIDQTDQPRYAGNIITIHVGASWDCNLMLTQLPGHLNSDFLSLEAVEALCIRSGTVTGALDYRGNLKIDWTIIIMI